MSNMRVHASPMHMIYEILVCNGHDMLNQINNMSHEFNKVKPNTGYQLHGYSQNWRNNEYSIYIQPVQ